MIEQSKTAEDARLEEDRRGAKKWRLWGPYLSERQWGVVREDYSPGGDAWGYLPHDQAPARAYRWGEDGLAGYCDDRQRLCQALGLWNGKDPILKERLFGLANNEVNHGEDVKEFYYYLDATPTHSYLKYLYKYPQREFPYALLVDENRRRGRGEPEFELLDAGIFDDDRYFDVFVEYAKESPDETVMRVTVYNRGPDEAEIHVLPQLWFRNDWTWRPGAARPTIRQTRDHSLVARHDRMGVHHFHSLTPTTALFCENETNVVRLFGNDARGPFKDAFHDYLIRGDADSLSADRIGSKAAFHLRLSVPGGGRVELDFQLGRSEHPLDVERVLRRRKDEADEFYGALQNEIADPDARLVQRQAFAGMIWNKQFYYYDVPEWLDGDPVLRPPPSERKHGRNSEWRHLNNADVISMPDKWDRSYAHDDILYRLRGFAWVPSMPLWAIQNAPPTPTSTS